MFCLKNFRYLIFQSLAVCAAGTFSADSAQAMPAPVSSVVPMRILSGRISPPVESGVLVGGQSGVEFSLIGVRSETAPEILGERIIFDYGNRQGAPQNGEPGFFHVAIDQNAKRAVIDLAQIRSTTVDPQKLKQILGASKLVSESDMTMDPIDGTTNITLNFSRPVRLRVGSRNGDRARLEIEVQPIEAPKGDRK